MKFENIKNIDISTPTSWQDKVFLTFDIDWCSDEVLSYTLDIINDTVKEQFVCRLHRRD